MVGITFGANEGANIWYGRFSKVGTLAALVAALGVFGCSLTVEADRAQCETDADCSKRGVQFGSSQCVDSLCVDDPRWSCMGRAPAATPSGPFRVGLQLTDLVSQAPLGGLRADLCRKVDVACADPVTSVTSDRDGRVTFDSVEAAFSGYVSLSAEGIVPTLYFFNPPVDSDLDVPALSLSTSQSRGALLGQLGADTALGDVLLNSFDCAGKPASGISYTLSPSGSGAIPFYLSSGLPTRNAATTDATGYGGFVNVPAGTVTIKATEMKSGRNIQTLTLVVRPGASTWSKVIPDGT